jgi:hypothetical protein
MHRRGGERPGLEGQPAGVGFDQDQPAVCNGFPVQFARNLEHGGTVVETRRAAPAGERLFEKRPAATADIEQVIVSRERQFRESDQEARIMIKRRAIVRRERAPAGRRAQRSVIHDPSAAGALTRRSCAITSPANHPRDSLASPNRRSQSGYSKINRVPPSIGSRRKTMCVTNSGCQPAGCHSKAMTFSGSHVSTLPMAPVPSTTDPSGPGLKTSPRRSRP